MNFMDLEVQRLRSLRTMQAGLLELKLMRDALRFERSVGDHVFTLKYGYNPAQPRVPIGRDGAGEWTATAVNGNPLSKVRSRDDRIRLAGDWPSNSPPEPLEKEPESFDKRPATSRERTSIIKYLAHSLAQTGATVATIAGTTSWLLQYEAEIISFNDPPVSLEELQRDVSTPRPGYDKHHIVEQTAAERDGFPRELIDDSSNLARIPRRKHQDITGWYKKRSEEFAGLSPREYLEGRSWAVRRAIGLEALRKFKVLKP